MYKATERQWRYLFRATPEKKEFAIKLRRAMTPAELAFWRYLNSNYQPTANPFSKQRHGKILAEGWEPQVVIKGWIVDFYHAQRLLAVEVDGSIHDTLEQREKDEIKDKALAHFGIRVLRVRNEQMLRSPELAYRSMMGMDE